MDACAWFSASLLKFPVSGAGRLSAAVSNPRRSDADLIFKRIALTQYAANNDLATPRMGWAGVKNGRLLALAEQQLDVFVTGDRNMSFQQDIPQLRIAVVVLDAASTQLKDTLPLMPPLLAKLPQLQPGTVTVLVPRMWQLIMVRDRIPDQQQVERVPLRKLIAL